MKKTLCFIFTFMMISTLVFTGCGKSNEETTETEATTAAKQDVFSGSAADVLAEILNSTENDIMVGDQEVNAENCEDLLGLTPEQYEQYVTDAAGSTAMINVHAHLVVLLKTKDFDSAAKVKSLIADNFNPQRWVCVLPEKCFVVDSGSYVMFVASFKETADAFADSFNTLAKDTAGKVEVFYTSED